MIENDQKLLHRLFGKPVFQFLATFTASLNLINSGMHFGWTSPALPQLLSNDSQIPITSDQAHWVASTITLGIVTGAIISSCLLDKFGRKAVILSAAVTFFVSWLLIAFAKTFSMLVTARLVAGVADALSYCSVSIYIGEIAEPRFRGLLAAGASTCWIFGILLINVVGSYFSIRTSAVLNSFVSIVTIATFLWMPESPYYSIMKNNLKQAAKNLRILKGENAIQGDLFRLTNAVQEQYFNSDRYAIFREYSNRKALLIAITFRILQQCTGLNALTFYTQILFREGGDAVSARFGSVIYFALFLAFNILCSGIVDKTGRKPLLIVSAIGTCAILFMESCYFYIHNRTDIDISTFSWVPTIGLLIHAATYSIGLQGIIMLLCGELFSTGIKPLAVCITHVSFAATTAIVVTGFQHLKDSFGVEVPLLIFSAFCAIILVFVVMCVPETKGKTLEEIQEELKSKSELGVQYK